LAEAKEETVNLGGNKDLDALLRRWPAPPPKGVVAGADEERGWEERADAIARAAVEARSASSAEAEALFEAPKLDPEPGEDAASKGAGEKKMSQEKDPAEAPASTTSGAAPPTERKRQSLKEIAARASQASQSGARHSQPGSPPSARLSQPGGPASARPSSPPSAAPKPSQSASSLRASEAGKDDSGVINLAVVQKSATPAQVAAAEKAKPGQADLFEDDKPAEAKDAEAAPKAVRVATVAQLQPKKSNTGLYGGVAIAVLGLAAAVGIVSRRPPPPPPVAAAPNAPAKTAEATPTPAPTAAATASPDPGLAASALPDKVAEAAKGTAAASGAPAPDATEKPAAGAADPKLAAKAASTGTPGDLQSEMAKRVKSDGPKQDQAITPEPTAAALPKNQNIPEQPSQGAVAAALNPVMGGAKACVAGADDVTRATVNFASAGNVTSVSVSGWAAAHGKSGCVQAALKGAKTQPFSKPSFTVGVPIRP
jgi:hypothetical protein